MSEKPPIYDADGLLTEYGKSLGFQQKMKVDGMEKLDDINKTIQSLVDKEEEPVELTVTLELI